MAFPGRPAPFAAVSGAAWETWDLEQVADTGGGARKPGGGAEGQRARWEGGKASTLGCCGGQPALNPLRGSSENLCGIQLGEGQAGALIQWLLLPPQPLPG